MTPEECRYLLEFDTWANDICCNSCAPLTPEQFTRDLGSSFPSVRDTLVHLMGAQRVWLERFRKTPSPKGMPQEFSNLAAVLATWAAIRQDLQSYVNGLSRTDLETPFEYKNMKGDLFHGAPGPILQHLVNHGTYHRGQISTLLRQLGAKVANTDFINFQRIHPAQ